MIVSRHVNELEGTAATIRGYNRDVLTLQTDITREDQVRKMVVETATPEISSTSRTP